MSVTRCYNKVKGNINPTKKGGMVVKMVGLREIRKKKGYSQLKVALDLNITREALSYYENGKRNPDLEMLVTFSKYYGKSIDYLITGHEFST